MTGRGRGSGGHVFDDVEPGYEPVVETFRRQFADGLESPLNRGRRLSRLDAAKSVFDGHRFRVRDQPPAWRFGGLD